LHSKNPCLPKIARKISFTLKGRPITKKNSQRIVIGGDNRRYIIQKKAYREYEKNCLWQLNIFKSSQKNFTPLKDCYMVAEYWMPNKVGEPDLAGLIQSTCDILEAGEIVKNDKYIRQFGFGGKYSRVMGIDEGNPRVEIILEEDGNNV